MTLHCLKTAAAAALALSALGAQAQVSNGNFSNGLTGWAAAGDVAVQSGAATLTTAFTPDPLDGPFNLSGTGAVYIDALVLAAGVSAYALDLPSLPEDQHAYEGSLLKQSFSIAAGQVLSFDWSFSSRDTQFLDNAFVVVNGVVTTLATTASQPFSPQTFNRSFSQATMVTLAFGVADTGDFYGVSTLSVDNVRISPVPEPAAWTLLLTGACGVAFSTRRRRVQAPLLR